MDKNISQLLEEELDLLFDITEPVESWTILYKGQQIKTISGRSLWKKKGHAKAALTNMVGHLPYKHKKQFPDMKFSEIDKAIKSAVSKMIKDGIIEFKQLS